MVLGGLPALAGALGLAALSVSSDGGGAVIWGSLSIVVLQLVWVIPALLAGPVLARALPSLDARGRRFRVLAPAFFLAYIAALPLSLVPMLALPILVFGPVLTARFLMAQALTRG